MSQDERRDKHLSPSRRTASLGLALLLALAAFLAYANTFRAPFILDDVLNIENNTSIRGIWPPWAALAGDYDTGVAGRPAVNFSFALNRALTGPEPWGFHAVNLAIHILASLFLFGIVRRTLETTALAATYGADSLFLAFACALVWVLHPINTMAVTYVTQRLESLMGLCFFACLYFAVRGWGSLRPRPWHALSAGACFAGVLCKEVMVTAPFMVLAYDRVFVHPRMAEALKKSAGLYAGLFCSLAVLGLLLLSGHTLDTAYEQGPHLGPIRYALAQPGAILHYLRLIAWPDALCLDYGDAAWDLDGHPAPSPLNVALYIAGLAALVALTLWALWSRKPWGFLLAWFFGILAPTSSFVPLRCFVEEHRMYLPSAALAVAAVAGVYALARRWPGTRPAGAALLAVAALALGFATHERNRDYASGLSIWADTVQKRPANPRALNNLGMELNNAKRYGEALPVLQKSLELGEDPAKVHCHMGASLAGMGRHAEAVAQFEKALETSPELVNGHHALANSLMRLGRTQEAIAHYEKAAALRPKEPVIPYALGMAYGKAGRVQDARRSLEKAVELNPEHAGARFELANAYAQEGAVQKAEAQYEKALQAAPGHAGAHKNLGSLFLADRKYTRAAGHLEKAAALCPQDAPARLELARALAAQGNIPQALGHAETAVALAPGSGEAHQLLGMLLLASNKNREAEKRLLRAVEEVPGRADLETLLGVALARVGKCGDSLRHLSLALEAEPGYTPAKNTYAIVSRDCQARFKRKKE